MELSERMQKVLMDELGLMTESEQLAYLKELIERYPDIAVAYMEDIK